ncbi:MAG TPA: amidohydrolase [Gammaproteobacteria bacterium]|nr:amidohydrolase [Gammaproteobacteria bacterium]
MFHTCNSHGAAIDHPSRPRASSGLKTLTVDIHCHCECYPVTKKMKSEAKRTDNVALAFGNSLTQAVNEEQLINVQPKMQSLDERLADMDAMGVDVQAITVPPYQYYYWAEPEVGREVTWQLNNHLAETVAKEPDRFVAMGTVPLQNTEMAVAELERCIGELGMRGVEISAHVGAEELSAKRLAPFFAKAEELDILIFIHPEGFSHADRFTEHYFINLIGHPLESTLAVSHLIFDGVLDRYPGLKICVAHGGGYIPSYVGRMDHAHRERDDCREFISSAPSSYLSKFYFDTLVFEPDQLAFLTEKYGSDRILLGTDYPYDMGEEDPLGLVSKVAQLDGDARAAVCGLNAARLLKLEV